MSKYIIRRLLQMIPVVFGSTFLIFAMVFALPGDPLAGKCGERPCPAAFVAKFRAEHNLEDPLLIRYFKYVGDLAHGNFGTTFQGLNILEELQKRYLITVKLAVIAIVFEIVVGILAGVLAGIRKGKFIDNLVLLSTLLVISVPTFVLGSVSQNVFGLKLGLFPVTVPAKPGWFDLLLPGMVLGSLSVAYVARLTRTNLAENLRADYVRTAVAKGLSRSRTIGVHTLRNSLIPVVTFIGADFGGLLGGAIITERIFNIRGVGGYIFQSIHSRDGVAVVGAVTMLVVVYLFMNLIVDVLYGVLDPRISHD